MKFLKDLVQIHATELNTAGVTFDESLLNDPLVFLADYLEYKRRLITPQQRRVELSKEIQQSPHWSTHQKTIQHLIQLTETGQDLTPYQSTQIKIFKDKPDKLLSDWYIHHLHLGEHIPGKVFAERSNELLYATFLEDVAFFIQIMDHTSFPEVDLLNIIDVNWPQYMEQFEIMGIESATPVPTSADIKEIRKARVIVFPTLKSGRIIGPPGGGYTLAGTSTICMEDAMHTARFLRDTETYIKENEVELRKQLKIGVDIPIHLFELTSTHITIIGEGQEIAIRIPIQQ